MQEPTIYELDAAVEALLFASESPLTVKDLSQYADASESQIESALSSLKERLDKVGGLQLTQLAGGYQLETKQAYYETIRDMFVEKRSSKLSLAALETLALIAYKQPITAIEIAELRMVTSVGSIVKNLLEKKLVKPAGRKKVVGRPMMYATTKEFLIQFGLNHISDLPALEDFQEKIAEEAGPDDEGEPSEGHASNAPESNTIPSENKESP